jgi:hypothetical protein
MRNQIKLMCASGLVLLGFLARSPASAAMPAAEVERLVGRPIDIAPSAYSYRADRAPDRNSPESWILLMQHADLPLDRPLDPKSPVLSSVLCGLLWEEVRPVRRLELSWPNNSKHRPASDEIVVTCFDATDNTAHTWWNPRTRKQAAGPEVSADGLTYSYAIPVPTWGVVVAMRNGRSAHERDCPSIRALVSDTWKRAEIEIEWGFELSNSNLDYAGSLEAYDGLITDLHPLDGDAGTKMLGTSTWRSIRSSPGRRGVRLALLYMGSSRWRRVWPYHGMREDVARTILTVRTSSGSFSFLASDLELGPILAPDRGFFARVSSPLNRDEGAAGGVIPQAEWRILTEKAESISGVPRVRGWTHGGMPRFGVNSSRESGKAGTLTIPARSAAMHPSPDQDVALIWRSPIKGRVRIQGRLAMADANGGNGVEWWLAHGRTTSWTLLTRGSLPPGGAEILATEASRKAVALDVEPGETICLAASARDGNHICDTTVVEWKVVEVGGQNRTWSLVEGVEDRIHDGNPLSDGRGNPDVWSFVAIPSDQTLLAQSAPSDPPFNQQSAARSAREFQAELALKQAATIRQRVRRHPEQSWEQAVAALHGDGRLPDHPRPALLPAMQIKVPSARLTAQWNLGAWHILRRTNRRPDGRWYFNDYPFGVLASETYMILRALDLQGMHKEAADGLDQWLDLPVKPRITPGVDGHHPWALPDRPLGHFSDGDGCLTHAEGSPGVGGHMDGVHCMGPGAIMFALIEHFELTGDTDWLRDHAPRLKANAEWILRQRRLLERVVPGGERLWGKGLQPANVVTPDSERMHMQFYETEAYYWLAVKRLAQALARIEPAEGERLNREAEAYRTDLLSAVARSIELTPVVQVRDGTYRSFIPFAPYVRGFAAGAWGWRRCQGHVGAIYWDTVQSADPLVSPAGLLSPLDPRVQGHLDVLEDRLLLENTKVRERSHGFDPEVDWFSRASWQYQCGLERHASIHLAADDIPNFLRSFLNQYAVDIVPGEYTFREHTTGGPPDKIYEESCFLERLRNMLIMEDADSLWLVRGTPRDWLESGKTIEVTRAPTYFGPVSYQIRSDLDHDAIVANLELPARNKPQAVLLRLRHPRAAPILSVEVNGRPWKNFKPEQELIRLEGFEGPLAVTVRYGKG